jgi:hypothetical protein
MAIAVLINTNPSVERPLQLRFELEQFESFFRLEWTKNAEVGKSFDGEHATKWLYESNLKLPKILRDMLFALGEKVSWHPDSIDGLQTVGYVHGDKGSS